MNLKAVGTRTIVKWAIWGVLGLLFVVFLIKVSVFENNYYGEKEGSERATVENGPNGDEPAEELIEEEPTKEEVHEYVVAPDRPRYLSVSKLGISNARILPMGVNSKVNWIRHAISSMLDGMKVPENRDRVGL